MPGRPPGGTEHPDNSKENPDMTSTKSDLDQLHDTVRGALAGATAAERKATDQGRDGDALLNAARVDCFDWVLQRIDELREQGEESTEFEVRWHSDADDSASCMSQGRIGFREEADDIGSRMVGRYGIVRWTVRQRRHRQFGDGSSWTGPWTRTDQEAEVAG